MGSEPAESPAYGVRNCLAERIKKTVASGPLSLKSHDAVTGQLAMQARCTLNYRQAGQILFMTGIASDFHKVVRN